MSNSVLALYMFQSFRTTMSMRVVAGMRRFKGAVSGYGGLIIVEGA